jgi:hypothetical protein
MKAITLIQPWATLIILGEKKIETRSWSTNLRGEIAIHAGKKIDKSVFEKPYYREAFKKYGITVDNIITSSLIGRCKIVDVKKTEDLIDVISEQERVFGNYDSNRYGWILDDFEAIEPIRNVKGMLGLWNYNF